MTDRRVEVFSGFISGLLGRFQNSRRLRRRRLKQVQHEHQYAECLETRTLLSAVNISVDTNVASEESGNVVTVTATAVEAVTGDQTITVTVSGDGITDGDLTFLNQSITIADGETIGTVTFTANDDGVLEINETATLTLSDFSAGVSAGATVSTNVTIVDNKQEVVTLDNVDQYPGSQPTLSWQAVAGAARYELWFSRVSPAASRIISDTQIATNSYTIQDNLAAGVYRYWVRAFDSNGDAAGWSSSKQFEVQPTLIGPTTAMFSSQPTFSWNSIPQAESYEIFLRTSEGDIVISDIDSNEYTHTEDLPAGNIRWWIRAGNSVGNTGWSHVGITSIVDRTSLISPGETLSTNRPTLEWETIGDASYYIVHVQNSASEVVGRLNNVRDNSYTFTGDLPDGEYTFWVKAIDAATDDFGDSAWSFPLSFTVEYVAPPIEVLTSQLTEAVNVIEDDALAPMLSTPISEHEDPSHAKSLITDQLTSFLDSVFRDMSGDIANEELAALVEFTSFGVHPAEIGAVLTGILAEIDDATARQILVNTYVRLNDDALAQAFVREISAVLDDQTIAALVLENGTQINNETATTLISDVIDALSASSSGVTDVLTRVRMNSDGRVALMNGLFDEVDDATLISIFRPIAEQSGFQG